MVFQSYALFPHYNVFDNVAYGLTSAQGAQGPRFERRVKRYTGAGRSWAAWKAA